MDAPERIWLDRFWTEELTGGHFRCTRHRMNTGGGGDIEYVRADDMDAVLARIRAAVEAERDCVVYEQCLRTSAPDHEVAEVCQRTDAAAAALDALLSEAPHA